MSDEQKELLAKTEQRLFLVHVNYRCPFDDKLRDTNLGIFSSSRAAKEAIYKDMRQQEELYCDRRECQRDVEVHDALYDPIDDMYVWKDLIPDSYWDHILKIGDDIKIGYEVLTYDLDTFCSVDI